MIIPLSGGHEAELRDQLLGGDRYAVRQQIQVDIRDDGSRTVLASMDEDTKYALLTRMIIRWDVPGHPLPRDAVDPKFVLDSLPLEDLEALLDAIQPSYERIMNNPKSPTPSSDAVSPNGSSDGAAPSAPSQTM